MAKVLNCSRTYSPHPLPIADTFRRTVRVSGLGYPKTVIVARSPLTSSVTVHAPGRHAAKDRGGLIRLVCAGLDSFVPAREVELSSSETANGASSGCAWKVPENGKWPEAVDEAGGGGEGGVDVIAGPPRQWSPSDGRPAGGRQMSIGKGP